MSNNLDFMAIFGGEGSLDLGSGGEDFDALFAEKEPVPIDPEKEDGLIHYADIHSHNSMAAQFSSIDDADEKGDRLYLVMGRLDQYFPEVSARICNGGTFLPIHPGDVLEGVPKAFPDWRTNRVRLLEDSFPIVDGDLVEKKNLVRQNFIEADLGENKAQVLAERYSSVFGLETKYIPSYIESEEELKKLVTPRIWKTSQYYSAGKWRNKTLTELVILIEAVDNNRSRSLCHRVFYQMKNLVYIDSGNGEYTGQVVCGVRSGGRTCHKPVGVLYPKILEETDKFPTQLSCAEASVSAPQAITANITAACAVVDLVYNILVRGETNVQALSFSTTSVNMRQTIKEKRRNAA